MLILNRWVVSKLFFRVGIDFIVYPKAVKFAKADSIGQLLVL